MVDFGVDCVSSGEIKFEMDFFSGALRGCELNNDKFGLSLSSGLLLNKEDLAFQTPRGDFTVD